MSDRDGEIAEFQAKCRQFEEALTGRRIVRASVSATLGKERKPYDRAQYVTLELDDGSTATIDFWASYADDASLELEVVT